VLDGFSLSDRVYIAKSLGCDDPLSPKLDSFFYPSLKQAGVERVARAILEHPGWLRRKSQAGVARDMGPEMNFPQRWRW